MKLVAEDSKTIMLSCVPRHLAQKNRRYSIEKLKKSIKWQCPSLVSPFFPTNKTLTNYHFNENKFLNSQMQFT